LEEKMGNAKIEFSIGGVSFSGEGDEAWLEKQLNKIIEKAPDLIAKIPSQKANEEVFQANETHNPKTQDSAIATQTLPNFLKQKNATKSQPQRFLATTIWLHAKGSNRVSTGDVTKALKDSNQARLGNPSDALAQNITKGYIERDGKQFFATEEGRTSFG
jgi:hypothetical protein